MKLFEYKPTEYVDVMPDLPLEWMQQEIDKTQTKYDAKLNSVNELNKEFYAMQAGAQTEEDLKAVNADYSKRINDMVSGLTGTGYIPQTSAELAKFISDVAIDPRVKKIKEDRALYEKHLLNALNPEYAGAFNMLDTRKPGDAYNPNLYKFIPAMDSVAKSRAVIQTMHPSSIDGGKTWTVTNPFTGKTETTRSYSEAVGVSKKRIREYTNYNYVNWKTDPDSYFDRMKLSNGDLTFWDKAEGRAVYDEKMKALEPLAYQTQDNTNAGIRTQSTKTKTKEEEEKEKEDALPKSIGTSRAYAITGALGTNSKGEIMNDYYSVNEQSNHYDKLLSDLDRQLESLRSQGAKENDPRIINIINKQKETLDEETLHEDRRRIIEGDFYGKDWEADIQAVLIDNPKLKEAYDDIQALKNKDTRHKFNNPVLARFMGQPSDVFTKGAFVDAFNKELGKKLKENGSKAGKVLKAYEDYANFSTSSRSYVIPETSKYLVSDLVRLLINDGKSAKELTTDLPVNAEKQKRLYDSVLNSVDGKYDFSRLTSAIHLDDKDGAILTVSGFLDPDNPNEKTILEYNLEDTPTIRAVLDKIAPPEDIGKLRAWTLATQSLKKSGMRKGEFTVPRYDGSTDVIKFTRMPAKEGGGKWIFKDADGGIHNSIFDLIEATTLTSFKTDITLTILESKRQEAIAQGNQEREAFYNNEITKMIAAEKAGKGQPQTQSNSLGW
jgi:hypothetical protein